MILKLVFPLCLIFSIFENFSSSKGGSLPVADENHRPRINGTAFDLLRTNRAGKIFLRTSKNAENVVDCFLGSSNSSPNCSELSKASFSKKSIDISKEEINENPNSVLRFLNASFYSPRVNPSAVPRNIVPETTKTVQHDKSRKKRDTGPPKKRSRRHESTKRYQLYPPIKTTEDGPRELDQSDFPARSGQGKARYINRSSSNIREKEGESFYFRAADEKASLTGSNNIATSIITFIVYGTTPFSKPISTTKNVLLQAETSHEQQSESDSTSDQVETETNTEIMTTIDQTDMSTEHAETGQPVPGQAETELTETEHTETGDTETEENTANVAPEVNYHYHFHYFGAAVPPTFSENGATVQ